jgi:hypothetical protein
MVKLPRQSESLVMRFEGRTSDEAVRLARLELGDYAPVRCWKARRGGLFGFFAREVFVAGVEAPGGTGPVDAAPPPVAASSRHFAWSRGSRNVTDPDAATPASPEGDSITELVEATRDELTLGSAIVLEAAFSDVLAQAQAALSLGPPDPDVATRGHSWTPTSAMPSTPYGPTAGPERIAGLRACVADFGVPSDYWPGESESSLDGLVRSFTKLPMARPLPTEIGSVVVVVGARRDAQVAALRVVELMGLDPSDLIEAECTSAQRQRVVRRRTSRVSVVTVAAPLRSRELAQVATWIASLKPDYVVGAVAAPSKRADVESWANQFDGLDALALSRVGETTSPGELLGDLPILLVDGMPSSALQWVALVLESMLGQR